jgi:Gluconate 2-dehydrogenase subunit 3
MERRDALRLLLAGAVIPAIPRDTLAFFELAHRQIAAGYALRTLNVHQNATVAAMVDLIIPETDTPGAKAARVNEFIDLILTEWATEEERRNFLEGVENVDLRGRAVFAKTFMDCEEAQQEEILRELDQAFAVEREEIVPRRPTRESKNKQLQGNFFGVLKRLTIYGYYTSEIGITQELQEAIIPGAYDGCIPLKQAKKAPSA